MNLISKLFKQVKLRHVLLFVIFSVSILISLPSLLAPMQSEADAYARSNNLAYHKEHNLFFVRYGGIWLPLHFTILIIPQFFFDNIYLTPRVVTLLFSSGSVVLIYFYSKLISDNKYVPWISSLLYLFFPLRFLLSTHTLSEPIFSFFLLTSLIILNTKNSRHYLGLLTFIIALGIRFEAWFLLPLIWAMISLNNSIKKKNFYIFLTLLFPALWLVLDFHYSGIWLNFFFQKRDVAQASIIPQYGNIVSSGIAWKNRLLEVIPLSFLFVAGIGYKKILEQLNVKQVILSVLPLYLIAILIVQVFLGTMEWFPARYLLLPITLLIPLVSLGISKIFYHLNLIFLNKYLSWLIILITCAWILTTKIEATDILVGGSFSQSPSDARQIANFYNKYKQQAKPHTVWYFYGTDRPWLDQEFFYYEGQLVKQNFVNEFPKSEFPKLNWEAGDIVVLEKDGSDTNLSKNYPKTDTLFQNSTLMLLKVSDLK